MRTDPPRLSRSAPAFAAALLALLVTLPAAAEHRVALLIDASAAVESGAGRTALPPAVKELQAQGFRTEVTGALPEKDLRRRVESWAALTPTNSTALLYFRGQLRSEPADVGTTLSLLAADDRPVPLRFVLEQMQARGGSRTNHLVIDSPVTSALSEEVPANCFVSFRRLPASPGPASQSVAPPDRFTPGKHAGDEWVNSRGMIFCWCPPGTFLAGSSVGTPGRHADEAPREIIIPDGFWIGKYELTDSQNLRGKDGRSLATHKSHPVNMLHWDDGRGMLKRFTEEEQAAGRLPSGWQYDLPTEEQWEYAARAGTTTRYYFGDDLDQLPLHANFADKSYYDSGDIFSNYAHRTLDDGFVRLAPAGSFQPNAWGLHDVYGNVAEWCRDHGVRGGGWVSVGQNCRSAYRDTYSSRNEQTYLGYRLIIQPIAAEMKE